MPLLQYGDLLQHKFRAGVVIDSSGDAIMSDAGNKLIRVLYMGGTQMGTLITLENPGVTPVVGSIYAIAGGGTHGIGASTPHYLGTQTILNTAMSVALDGAGNVYLGETTADVAFLDINTGFIRVLFANGTPSAAKADSVSDGCPAGQSSFGVGSGSATLPISVDNLGNLYMTDSLNSRARKVSASSPMPMTVGTAETLAIVVHGLAGVTTSGLPVSYSVISGNASVTGSTLTVSGTGPVTVQATQSIDPTGDYAAATPVSRSFAAQ